MPEDSDALSDTPSGAISAEILLYVESGYAAKRNDDAQDARRLFRKAISRIDDQLDETELKQKNENSTALRRTLELERARLVDEMENFDPDR